jgi:dTDP-4-amino-4,6-dideoxygalactose transaminase
MGDLPAVLGGTAIFNNKINIVRPVLPDISDMSEGVGQILSSGMVTKGQFLRQFEQTVAEHLGVRNVVAVSSCTSGLMLTQKSLGLTGEVVVPSFTFMATISSLVWSGLQPVFADVDPGTTNLDAACAEQAITARTSAILAVHNFGNPADIAELQSVADRHGIPLIFDAAHGFGAQYQGDPVGKQGTANIYSLSPTKLLIAGEGGVVATNDDELADKLRYGREYGNNGNYDSLFAGLNARMPEFNALLGFKSLLKLEDAALSRNETAGIFHEMLGKLPGIGFQEIRNGNRCSYKDFSITVSDDFGLTRDQLAVALGAENIDTRKYYDPPAHRQIAYKMYADHNPLANTNWLAGSSLSLPMWSNMEQSTALKICEAITRIYQKTDAIREQFIQLARQ